MKIIFIAGIHGVGKTTFCKKYELKNVYTASELIKNYKIIDGKLTKNIFENQDILIEAISQIKEEKIYLDGHLCLLDFSGKIKELPLELYKKLNILEIILLISTPFKIQERLNKRDKTIYNVELLKKFQEKEIERAKYIAQELNIKLTILEN
ncbi:AAA family ATPase [Fusobacterium canifelinum]|uniref:AAA family ATPase n=1 Tax=Fusobacterium canifelinum TaxID=285729 RepID=UPI0030CC7E80